MNIVSLAVHSYFCPRFILFMPEKDDTETSVQLLKDRIKAFAVARDWEQFHTPKNLSMAIAAEAAELMEHFLWKKGGESHDVLEDSVKRQEIAEELADILIFALEFANIAGMDIATIIREKMTLNAQKYPVEKARGKADKYTDL